MHIASAPIASNTKNKPFYANTFRHPKAHRIRFIRKSKLMLLKRAGRGRRHAAKPRYPSKYAIPKARPSQRKQDGKKTNPDTLTDDKKHTRHPASKFIWAETCANANRIPTSLQRETVKENCVSIDRQNCFTKSVKQARKNIWTRRKTPLRARDRAAACYGTLFANMCIIRAYLEIIWLDFDRSCPYCSL